MTETSLSSLNIVLSLTSGLVGALFGIIGAFGLRWWEVRKRLNGIENAIRLFLENEILVNIKELKKDCLRCIELIPVFDRKNERLSAFEGFNQFIYRANKPEDYFRIYKEKAVLLNQIFAMINFLSGNLPLKVFSEFNADINKHLNEEKLKGNERRKHFNTCQYCLNIQERYIFTFQNRIKECELLEQKIKELLKTN